MNYDNQEFSVKNVKLSLNREFDINLPPNTFCWNRWVIGKSMAFVWRAIEEKIPSATALRNKGMNQIEVTCKTCGAVEESAVHILLRCNFAKRVWEAITKWLRIPMVNIDGNLKELLQEILELHRSRNVRKAIHATVIQTMWILWKTRNEKLFKGKQSVIQTVIEDIKNASFLDVKLRSKYHMISRQEWWDFNVNM
ncbi:putative reverse transcriptase zinc-binding domain-containing protein [Helianthus anomalus]